MQQWDPFWFRHGCDIQEAAEANPLIYYSLVVNDCPVIARHNEYSCVHAVFGNVIYGPDKPKMLEWQTEKGTQKRTDDIWLRWQRTNRNLWQLLSRDAQDFPITVGIKSNLQRQWEEKKEKRDDGVWTEGDIRWRLQAVAVSVSFLQVVCSP